MLQEVKGRRQRDSRRRATQPERQESRRIFGRRILPRSEIGDELRCREAAEDAVVVMEAVDNCGVGKCVIGAGGC